MARQIFAAVVIGLMIGSWGEAEPVGGPSARKYEIDGAGDGEPVAREFAVQFHAGRRACVIARGDHDPVVPLDITVYDPSGAVVARDESAKDFVSVFWTPPRTAEYRVVIRNHGHAYNILYVVFK